MDILVVVVLGVQLIFAVVGTIYFCSAMGKKKHIKQGTFGDSKIEQEKLRKMRSIHLTEPLSERTRPKNFNEIVGQEKAIRALKAAICGPNPQHVILYGPPGVGKTAAARLVLDEARANRQSPFSEAAKFVELDATTLQFDERSIADPLIGSVHDPIYQGAGVYGAAGIPQPKIGAVSKAHGGVLFLDEIGEMHPIQINKLLKVLEDRAVHLTSVYYSREDRNIPAHIHDIFKNGLPADFRLIGATTRSPEEIPPAIRSRCTEIFFTGLKPSQVEKIAKNAIHRAGFSCDEGICAQISEYSSNGRDTVNIVQTAASIAISEQRRHIKTEDVEWVLEFGHYAARYDRRMRDEYNVGVVNGLAVCGMASGAVLEIESVVSIAKNKGCGKLMVTGIIEEEEINGRNGKMRRVSSARGSIENVITVLNEMSYIRTEDYDIHVNFAGGMPVDGPSAGVAMFSSIYSAFFKKPVNPYIAMTGEVSIKGKIHPVGGVYSKIEAAVEAGAKKVIIPRANYQKSFAVYAVEIIPIDNVEQLIDAAFCEKKSESC